MSTEYRMNRLALLQVPGVISKIVLSLKRYGINEDRRAMTHMLPDQLHTRRMILRAPRSADAAHIFEAYAQDMHVARHMVWRPHQAISESEAFIAYCMQAWAGGSSRPYVVALNDDEHVPIGMLEARLFPHTIDLGYVLARKYWGDALMPEAIVSFTEAAQSLQDCFPVQATCHVDNTASARTLEKSGFLREGRLERYAMFPNIDDKPQPCFMYARCIEH